MNNELKTMKNEPKKGGFSLTEILLAVGTLGIGMLFIAGTFLAGIHFSTISAEQTTAAIAADEAFAKIQLYSINLTNLAADQLKPYEALRSIDPNEFAYPSTNIDASHKQYYWSALCRLLDSSTATRLVQVTIFVSRKVGSAASYRGGKGWPIPMQVVISGNTGSNSLIYRVLKRDVDQPNLVILDRPWQGSPADSVWVVPPPIGGGRNPTIAIYQKVMRF